MILAIAKIADFNQFLETFSTIGVEKRREHGCKGSWVFRDPDDPSRVWAVFDWELKDDDTFLADPEIPEIAAELGVLGTPLMATSVAQYDS